MNVEHFTFGFNNGQMLELLIRFSLDIAIATFLIVFVYLRHQKKYEYAFTYYLFNALIFFVCYMLSSATLSIGFAFGLFAIFAILRYRTDPIPIKEMTYLFLLITLGVINALSSPTISVLELLIPNVTIASMAYLLERIWYKDALEELDIIYEKIDNIKPGREEQLLTDIKDRTGLTVVRYRILRTDFLRDTATIKIYYLARKI